MEGTRAPSAAADDEVAISIGQSLVAPDGTPAGEIQRVVTTPTLARLTHLVVRPNGSETGKLVPISAVRSEAGELRLVAPDPWPEAFPDAESIELLGVDPRLQGPDLTWPLASISVWPEFEGPAGPLAVIHEHLPAGEVAVGVGAEIIDEEGPIGRVAGFLAHPSEGRITHVVLRHGHLWGRRTVMIPVERLRVAEAGDLELRCTRDELGQYTID